MKLMAKGVSRTFFRNGKNTNFFYAVRNTDFILEEGRVTEIIGRSGSGKTTFSNMLAGLLRPSEGKILIDGTDLYALDDRERSIFRNQYIGVIPQGQTGLQSLTVLENVLVPASMYGDPSAKKQRATELLDLLGIVDLCDVYSNELSGGELRRMSIARALVNDPKILIADEPTGDLDDENTHTVLRLLRKIADNGTSVLLVTHENEAISFADKIYVMNNGILTMEGADAVDTSLLT